MPNDRIGLFALRHKPADPTPTLDAIHALLARGLPELEPDLEPTPTPVPTPTPAPVPTPGQPVHGVPEGTPPLELIVAVQRYFPLDQQPNALRVSYYESGWRATARNNTLHLGPCGTRYFIPSLGIWAQTEDSIGYFQINRCAHGGTLEEWYDADRNTRYAFGLWRASGWSGHWKVTAGRLGLR